MAVMATLKKILHLVLISCLVAAVLVVDWVIIRPGLTTIALGNTTSSAHVILFNEDHLRRSLCQHNPYVNALNESLEEVGDRMDTWLLDVGHQHELALSGDMFKHTHARFFPFDSTMGNCKESLSCVGGACGGDTSKIVCGLQELQKISTSQTQHEESSRCIVYSIGGNNQWQFELDILLKTPCEVHTFDCTGRIDRFDKQPKNKPRLHFHHVCLGTRHEDTPAHCEDSEKRHPKCGETWTLLEMQKKLQHNRIDLFKIDIEGYEWPLLESWPELADEHAKDVILPMQILVEVHYQTQFDELRPNLGKRSDFRFARDMVNLQAHLLRIGYVVVERDDNRRCPHCTELTLLRARCPTVQSTATVEKDPSTSASLIRRETSTTADVVADPVKHNSAAAPASQTAEKLQAMGLAPLYNPKFDSSDPWKAELYGRLDRVRVACGELCKINSVEALDKHSVPIESQQLPMVVVPNVDCPAILGLQELDASDLTTPSIPDELLDYFTLQGVYHVSAHEKRKDIYLGGESETSLWKTGNVWEEHDIDELVNAIANGTAKGSYGVNATLYVRNKISEIEMKGMSVLVIGSSHPWVEAICLHFGAAKVTTLEYGTIVSKHPNIFTLTPDEFRAKFLVGELEDFDGVVSHSSLEHSGLGRYGDALNPWGDILALARAWCVTKTGGFLYLGLPTGKDFILSNWHRTYGKLRWPLISANWRRIDQSDGDELKRGIWMAQGNGGWGYIFRKEAPPPSVVSGKA